MFTVRRESVRVLLCFYAALLVTSGFAPRAFAAFIELHSPVTYNMQGAATGNGSKWTSDVLPLSNTHDIVALQEAGASVPGQLISTTTTSEGTLTQYRWSVGTSTSPDIRYIYFLQTDPGGNRVNLAIVTRRAADDVTTIQGGIPGVSRGALGVRLGLMWFYDLHGLSSGGNDDAQLILNIASRFTLPGFFWTALGDFNRDPSLLTIPYYAVKYTSGQATQQSGGELDYMVSNDDVDCTLYAYYVSGNRLGGLSSDHYPVDLTLRPCIPLPDSNANLTLMSIGDDIVVGTNNDGSYRGDLQNDLTGDGFQWNFVGTQQNGALQDANHEGYGGADTGDLPSLTTGDVQQIQPDLITIMAGAQDLLAQDNPQTAAAGLGYLVDDYVRADPKATIIVATMLPLSGEDSAVADFNSSLVPVIQARQKQGVQVLLADMGPVTQADFTYPTATATGYQKMADSFFQSILVAISLHWLPTPFPCAAASYCGPGGGGSGGGGGGVCDIFGSKVGTVCVAAHSTVRPLFSSYKGKLYQVQRASDHTTFDVGVSATTGYAQATAQDIFCANTTCTITTIYDQTSYHNDLTISSEPVIVPGGGTLPNNDTGAVANALPITVHGSPVYGVLVTPGVGYRNDNASGMPKGLASEGMYMVTSGTFVNDQCCFDYGNAETTLNDTGAGHMDALNFGTFCMIQPCSGSGPWVEADLENGQFMGSGANPANPSIGTDFVTAMLYNDGTQSFSLRSGDATTGYLTTGYSGPLPAGYSPMQKEGGIVLGTGGDNSHGGQGSFFEGAIISGAPTGQMANDVQANIVAAGYAGNSAGNGNTGGGGGGVGNVGPPGPYTGPSDSNGPQGGFGSPATVEANDIMASKPALASFNNSLYVAFQGKNADNDLYVASAADGVSFPAATRYTNISVGSAPAMAAFNNQLFIAFEGNDSNQELFVTSSSSGAGFPNATMYPGIQMGGSPAMAVFNSQLYIAFQAKDAGHTLHVTSSANGTNFPDAWQVANIAIGSAPAMAAFNGKLYIAFRADDPSNEVWIASSSDGVNWSSQGLTGLSMGGNSAPALVASNGTLYCIYGANDTFNEMLAIASNDGSTWNGPAAYLDTKMGPTGPGATAFGTGVSVGFQSNDSRGVLFVTSKMTEAPTYTGPSDTSGIQGHFLTPAIEQPNVSMGSKPALATFGGKVYVAFQGLNANGDLYVTTTTGQSNSSPAATRYTNISMGGAPAMAGFNNKLYIAFQANDPGHTLHVTASSDGISFPAASQIANVQIGSAPAMAVFNNALFIAFQANDPGHTLHVMATLDGVTWTSAWQVPSVVLGGQPAMVACNGSLYVAWRADDPSNDAWIASSTDGLTWSSQSLPGQTMGQDSSPALASAGTTLFYIYGANDAANEMLVTTSKGGGTLDWTVPAAYPNLQMSPTGPGASFLTLPSTVTLSKMGIIVGFQSNDSRDVLFTTLVACQSTGGSCQ